MENDKKILTVIVTYNGEPWIRDCLRSVQNSEVATDCLVIDNHSSDHVCSIIRNEFPEVQVVAAEENLGFGKANNIGLKKALSEGYDYVLLLNQDAGIAPDMLSKLIQQADADPAGGIFTPVHLNGRKDALDYGFAEYMGCKTWDDLKCKFIDTDMICPEFVNAAIWFIPTRIIQQIGGFNPLFYHYGEDLNWVHRLHFHQYHIRLVKDTWGYHDRYPQQNRFHNDVYGTRVYTLVRILNPGYDFGYTFLWLNGAIGKKIILSSLKMKFREVFDYLKILKQLYSRLREIRQNRYLCKKRQPSFL